MDDGFKAAPDIKGGPIPNEDVLENIRAVGKIDLPVLAKQKPHGGTLVFVAGGPSLLGTLEHLRAAKAAGAYVMTSNHTHDFLIENGVIPDACVLIDPRAELVDAVKQPRADVQYYVATVCNPKVYEGLAGMNVTKILVAYGMESEEDLKFQNEIYKRPGKDFVVGGTMTPLRVMPLAVLLGYTKLEFYGFDSCYGPQEPPTVFEEDPRYKDVLKANGGLIFKDSDTDRTYTIDEPATGGFFYAYKKLRPESIEVAKTSDGRTFLTSPGFAHQAKQFMKWIERLDGKLEVTVHGDSLNRHMLELHRAHQARLKAEIGDRRWTEGYAAQQRQMHDEKAYGLWGDHEIGMIARGVLTMYDALKRPMTLLDYGAGNGALGSAVEALFRAVRVTNYDPFHPKWRGDPEPEPHDITVSCDVMEHVETQCVDNTLKYIAERTRYMAIFNIALDEATKELPNGQNAHITIRQASWWAKKLGQHFVVVESKSSADSAYFVCQKQDAKEVLDAEKASRAGSANSMEKAA